MYIDGITVFVIFWIMETQLFWKGSEAQYKLSTLFKNKVKIISNLRPTRP